MSDKIERVERRMRRAQNLLTAIETLDKEGGPKDEMQQLLEDAAEEIGFDADDLELASELAYRVDQHLKLPGKLELFDGAAVWVLSIVGLWLGREVMQNKRDRLEKRLARLDRRRLRLLEGRD